MKIFTIENIFLNQKLDSKQQVFDFVAQVAVEKGIVNDGKQLVVDLWSREEQITTGIEQEFAIPHCQSNVVSKPTLFFISLQTGIDWQNFDGTLAKYLFVILLPKVEKDTTQVETLSKIATLVLDSKISSILKSNDKNAIFEAITSQKESENIEEQQEKPLAIGITSCPVGIAHTYLAAERLEQALIRAGYKPHIETRGSVGAKNVISQSQITQAQFVIIAADVEIDDSIFVGKKVLKTSTKEAIHKSDSVVEKAKNASVLIKEGSTNQMPTNVQGQKTGFIRHIITGISYMIPYVIFGGIMIALSLGIGKAIYGNNSAAPKGDFLDWMLQIGVISFQIMIGALGAYIAYSIAGRAALMPGFVTATIANNAGLFYSIGGITVVTPMGFIGAILFGFLVGHTVKYITALKIQKSLSAIVPMFVIPIGVTLFYSLIVIFVIGAPVGWVMDKFIDGLKSIFSAKGEIKSVSLGVAFILGILLGGMAGFDMGGPINKVAFLTSSALVTSGVFEPMGMVGAAIPVAPLGMGLTTLVFYKKFNKEEKSLGVSALIMGFIGISEGAIPFAVADPKRVILANVVGSAVAGGIAGLLLVTNAAAHGGPIVAILGAVGSHVHGVALGILFFFIAIIAGSLTTMLIYGFTRNRNFAILDKIGLAIKKSITFKGGKNA